MTEVDDSVDLWRYQIAAIRRVDLREPLGAQAAGSADGAHSE
jgi:hypothetical protein